MKKNKKINIKLNTILVTLISVIALVVSVRSCQISSSSFELAEKINKQNKAIILQADFRENEIIFNPINPSMKIVDGIVYFPEQLSDKRSFSLPQVSILYHPFKGNLLLNLNEIKNLNITEFKVFAPSIPLIIDANYIADGERLSKVALYRLEISIVKNRFEKLIDPQIKFHTLKFIRNFDPSVGIVDSLNKMWNSKKNWINANDSLISYGNKSARLNYEGKYKQALYYAEKGIELSTYSGALWSNKAYALQNLGKKEDALKAYNKAVANNPTSIRYWANKSGLLSSMARYDEALFAANKAIMLDSSNTYSWNNRASALLGLKEYNLALNSAYFALELDPLYHINYKRVAECHNALGETEEASSILELLKSNGIKKTETLLRLCNLLIKNKKHKYVSELLRRAVMLDASILEKINKNKKLLKYY